MEFSGNHVARIAILSVAFILCVVALFLPWWTIHAEFGNASQDSSARPFDAGDLEDDPNDSESAGLSTEVVITGILFVLATLAALVALTLEVVPVTGRRVDALHRLLATAITLAFGLAAVLYTAFAWPAETDFDFYDSQSFGGGGFFGGSDGSLSTYAGAGWYVAIGAAIVLPVLSFLLSLREPSARRGG